MWCCDKPLLSEKLLAKPFCCGGTLSPYSERWAADWVGVKEEARPSKPAIPEGATCMTKSDGVERKGAQARGGDGRAAVEGVRSYGLAVPGDAKWRRKSRTHALR